MGKVKKIDKEALKKIKEAKLKTINSNKIVCK